MEDGSALQQQAEEANVRVCLQVSETEKRDQEITKLRKEIEHLNGELSKAVQSCLSLEQRTQSAKSSNQTLLKDYARVRKQVRELKKAAKNEARDTKSQPTSDSSRSLVVDDEEPVFAH